MLCIAWLPETSFLTLFLRELCLKKLGITTQFRLMLEMISCFVSNKAKSRISKRVLQKNKEPQIFRKTNISYPLIRTRTCPYQGGEKCSFFQKIWCALFSYNTYFEIRLFTLLPTDSYLFLSNKERKTSTG